MNNSLIKIAQELKPKKFPLEGKLDSISDKVLEAHRDKLYHNYIKNYNKMISLLKETDFSKIKDDVPGSQFAEIKRRITWASNGAFLHDLYFNNIGNNNTKPGKYTINTIKEDFESLSNFKDDFLSSALVPNSGWAVWGYSFYDNKTSVVTVENHHNNCPIGFYPILVLDMWEHAYWHDHLTNKKKYINLFWKDINWDVVEKRCQLTQRIFKRFLKD